VTRAGAVPPGHGMRTLLLTPKALRGRIAMSAFTASAAHMNNSSTPTCWRS